MTLPKEATTVQAHLQRKKDRGDANVSSTKTYDCIYCSLLGVTGDIKHLHWKCSKKEEAQRLIDEAKQSTTTLGSSTAGAAST